MPYFLCIDCLPRSGQAPLAIGHHKWIYLESTVLNGWALSKLPSSFQQVTSSSKNVHRHHRDGHGTGWWLRVVLPSLPDHTLGPSAQCKGAGKAQTLQTPHISWRMSENSLQVNYRKPLDHLNILWKHLPKVKVSLGGTDETSCRYQGITHTANRLFL